MIRIKIVRLQFLFFLFAIISINAIAQAKNPVQLIIDAPAFLTEGDHLFFACRIKNNQQAELTGTINFSITNSKDSENIDGWFQNTVANQYFTVQANGIETAYFPIDVPYQFTEATHWKIKLQAGTFTDTASGSIAIRKNTEAIDSIKSAALVKTLYKKSANNWIKLNEWDEITDTDLIRLTIQYTLNRNYKNLVVRNISYAGLTELVSAKKTGYTQNNIELSAIESTIGSHTISVILKPTQKGKLNSGLTELMEPTSNHRIAKGNSLSISIN